MDSYICILDFQVTDKNEILEFTSILLEWSSDYQNYQILSKFHEYCNPLLYDIEIIEDVSDFPIILANHHEWVYKNTKSNVSILVKNNETMYILIKECKKWNIVPSSIYANYLNLSTENNNFYKTKSASLIDMMINMEIKLGYLQNTNIDNCYHIYDILIKMIKDGYDIHEYNLQKININQYFIKNLNDKKYILYKSKRLAKGYNY